MCIGLVVCYWHSEFGRLTGEKLLWPRQTLLNPFGKTCWVSGRKRVKKVTKEMVLQSNAIQWWPWRWRLCWCGSWPSPASPDRLSSVYVKSMKEPIKLIKSIIKGWLYRAIRKGQRSPKEKCLKYTRRCLLPCWTYPCMVWWVPPAK